MSLLTDYRDQFVLESMELYREFDMSHFISNAKTGITGKIETVKMNHGFDKNIGMLEKSIPVVNGFALDKSALESFNTAYAKIGTTGGTMVNDLHSLSSIVMKPQYLAQYIDMIGKIIDGVASGKMDETAVTQFVSGEASLRVQKQCVKADGMNVAGYDPKGMAANAPKSTEVEANDLFIKGKVLPFVTNFDKNKATIVAEATATLNAVKEANVTLQKMMAVLNTMRTDGSMNMDSARVTNQVSYNVLRGVMDITTYMTFMMLTKIAFFQDDVITCRKVFVDVTNKANGMVSEGVTDAGVIPMDTATLCDDMTNGKVDAFTAFAENIYQFHSGIPGVGLMDQDVSNLGDAMHSVVDMKIDEQPYNKVAYEDAAKMYIEISNGLDLIARTTDDYLIVVHDIINEAGFALRLEDRFRNTLETLDDLSAYTGARNLAQNGTVDPAMYTRMLAEIKAYPDNMQTIANVVMDTKTKLEDLGERYQKNINGEFKDIESINEVKIFLNDLLEQYRVLTNVVCGKFMKRLREIGNILTSLEASDNTMSSDTSPIETSSNLDFTEGVMESIYKEYDENTNSIFTALQMEYFTEKERALKGINVLFEAETDPANNPSGNAQPATGATPQQPQQAQQSTKVSVQDNSGEAKTGLSSILAKVSAWFRTMIDKFMEFIGKQGKKNIGWLNANKDALVNRSYNNVTINILPYNNVPAQTISNDIKKVLNAVKGMTPQNIQGIRDKNSMYKKLFSSIKGGIQDGTPLKDQFTKYYKVGTAELTVVPVSNGELKTEITNTIIPFCENFYGNFSSSVKTDLTQLGDAVDAAMASYNTQTTTESVSILMEADASQNTETSMAEKGKWMQDAVKMFAGSIMNAIRDRNNDYMKVLSSLAPKAPVTPAPTQQNPEPSVQGA